MTHPVLSSVRYGVLALGKSLLVLAGVPVVLWRLWGLLALPKRLFSAHSTTSLSVWLHLVVLIGILVWLWAAATLTTGLIHAVKHREVPERASWSVRWATAVVGLVVLSIAALSPKSAAPPTAVVQAQHGATGARALATNSMPASPVASLEPNEALDHFARRTLGTADGWRALARQNLNLIQIDGRRLTDPILVRPGWQLRLPASSPHSASRAAASSSQTDRGQLTDLAMTGLSGLLACGLAWRIRRARKLARTQRGAQERFAPPPGDVGALSARIAGFSNSSLIEWIDAANRLLWRGLRDRDGAEPDIALVRGGPDGIEFLLRSPLTKAPAPFVALQDGRWWHLAPTLGPNDAARLASGCGRYLPWLVPVGEDELASYLLPVGPGQRLSLEGDPDLVARARAELVLALRVLPWASELEVGLYGIAEPSMQEQSYHLETVNALALEELAEGEARALSSRLAQPWRREPIVVLGDANLDARVLDAAGRRAGVIGTFEEATFRLHVHDDHVDVAPFGLSLRPGPATSAQLRLADQLLLDCTTYARLVAEEPSPAPPPEERARTANELRLLRAAPSLGRHQHECAAGDLPRATELIAYLCLHGRRAPRDAVRTALFPEHLDASHDPQLEHVFAAARRTLGRHQDGKWILQEQREHYVLGDGLCSDWELAQHAISHAAERPPEEAVSLLSEALALFEGAPFSDALIGYRWVIAEGIDEWIDATLIDGAHHLASLALARGDIEQARWAIDIGRGIEWASEMLVRDLMACYEQAGEPERARAAFVELERYLADLDGNEPSGQTRAYYEHLVSGTAH